MPARTVVSLLALAVMPLFGCANPSACIMESINFSYLTADTSDTLQPGNKAAAQFSILGNPNLRLGTISITASAQTAGTATVKLYTSVGNTPDAGTLLVTSTAALPVQATTPQNPNGFAALTFTVPNPNSPPQLQPNVNYWAVFSATQGFALGIATAGQYTGAYETFGTSGWQASTLPTERIAIAVASPPCPTN